MIITFLAVIIVMVVINVFMIFVLKKIGKKVSKELSMLCIRGMADLNEFNEAETEHESLCSSREMVEATEEIPQPTDGSIIQQNLSAENKIKPNVVYKNIDFLAEYKAIKYAMQFEKEDVVKKFVAIEDKGIIPQLQVIKNLLSRYSFDLLFNVAMLDEENQLDIIQSTLLEKEKLLLSDYLNHCEKFECIEFMYYIKKEFYKYDDTIYIRTGEKEDNFEKIDKRIKTIYDPAICEGLKIIYNNNLYDYSI